jgi:hypothetical protein
VNNVFSPAYLPRSLGIKIPEEYTYPLSRAWNISGGRGTRELSKEFERQKVKLMGTSAAGGWSLTCVDSTSVLTCVEKL